MSGRRNLKVETELTELLLLFLVECQEPMRAGYIPLVAAPREVPVQENAQAGPSRHRAPGP